MIKRHKRRYVFRLFLAAIVVSACVTPYGEQTQDPTVGTDADTDLDALAADLAAVGVAPNPPEDGNEIPPPESGPPSRFRLRRYDVSDVLESMSLRDKIGQRFAAYLRGRPTRTQIEALASTAAPAGFILYPWNYGSAPDVRRLTNTADQIIDEATAGIRPLIMVDQEGGRVRALRFDSMVQLPSAFELGRLADPEFMRSVAFVNGVHLLELGVNMNLAPVLDLYGRPDATIIGDRAMGNDPAIVSDLARAYVEGARAAGLIVTGKHFPGHGVSQVDSHGSLPIVDLTLDDLRRRELLPFQAAVDAGVDVIMTAHILFRSIDAQLPVTLSPVFIKDLLRDEMGFEGVVMTDGLEMGAISRNFGVRETLELTLRAGVDLVLLYSSYDYVEMVDMVEEMVNRGVLPEALIDEGAARVLELKARYGLVDGVGSPREAVSAPLESPVPAGSLP